MPVLVDSRGNPLRSASTRPRRRSFQAAEVSRLAANWSTMITSIGQEQYESLQALRARARELAQNNDHVRRFLSLAKSNVIGHQGIMLRPRFKMRSNPERFDELANNRIMDAWRRWSQVGICTMDGKLSWRDVQNLVIETIARDGEILIRHVEGRAARNEFGYAIQLLEVDHFDDDRHLTLRRTPQGGKLFMGVETDRWGRPQLYHLLEDHPGDIFGQGRQRSRPVPADEYEHPFIMERAGQLRGLPWLVTAMLRLRRLGQYELAELVASEIGASHRGWLVGPQGDAGIETDIDEGTDHNLNDTPVTDLEAGQVQQLAGDENTKLLQFDPEHPTTAFKDFYKSVLRGIASGLNVSYESLSNDLEGVSYSSIRQGSLTERDMWRMLQSWTVEHVHQRIYRRWLENSVISGALELPADRLSQFEMPQWKPRGWAWVDPQKEVRAAVEAIGAGLKSRHDVHDEQGRDVGDTFDELAREQELASAQGLDVSTKQTPKNAREALDELASRVDDLESG